MANKKSRRKPKLFDFEHSYKAVLPEEALVEFDNNNFLRIRVSGMLAKDVDMELNMFLDVEDVLSIRLILPCQCTIQYNKYGKKIGKEWCEKHIIQTY